MRLMVIPPHGRVSAEAIYLRCGRQTPGASGRWGQVELVLEPAKADIFVRLERGSIPGAHRENTIYVQREPAAKLNQAFRRASRRITYGQHYHAALWLIRRSYDDLLAMCCPDKTKLLSAVVTRKRSGPLRAARLAFVVKLGLRTEIDVFGTFRPPPTAPGCCYRGWVDAKEDGLLDYRFTSVVECMATRGYFSEKLVDALLCWCKPIYYGAPDIAGFLPPASLAAIDPRGPDAVDRALAIMDEPIDYEAIAEARRRILNRYNLMATLDAVLP